MQGSSTCFHSCWWHRVAALIIALRSWGYLWCKTERREEWKSHTPRGIFFSWYLWADKDSSISGSFDGQFQTIISWEEAVQYQDHIGVMFMGPGSITEWKDHKNTWCLRASLHVSTFEVLSSLFNSPNQDRWGFFFSSPASIRRLDSMDGHRSPSFLSESFISHSPPAEFPWTFLILLLTFRVPALWLRSVPSTSVSGAVEGVLNSVGTLRKKASLFLARNGHLFIGTMPTWSHFCLRLPLGWEVGIRWLGDPVLSRTTWAWHFFFSQQLGLQICFN